MEELVQGEACAREVVSVRAAEILRAGLWKPRYVHRRFVTAGLMSHLATRHRGNRHPVIHRAMIQRSMTRPIQSQALRRAMRHRAQSHPFRAPEEARRAMTRRARTHSIRDPMRRLATHHAGPHQIRGPIPQRPRAAAQ